MTSTSTLAADPAPAVMKRWRHAAARAVERITGRVAVGTLAVALALQAWSLYEAAFGTGDAPASVHTSLLVANLLLAFSLLFTTFVADEFVASGARPLPAYASAVLVGSALGTLAQWLVNEVLARTPLTIPGLRVDAGASRALFIFFEYLIWGSIGVWIYVNRRGELRARTRMEASRLQRANMQRRSLEAQLKALQAQVEPQFLLDMLACARDRYEVDPASGSAMLGALIAYLRAALPRLREPSSDLGRELELARAYLDLVRTHLDRPLVFESEVPESLHGARLPAMLMLPLVHRIVVGRSPGVPAPRLIVASARVVDDRLRLRIVHDGCAFASGIDDADLAGIRERVQALYHGRASLAFHHGTSAILEIPFEPAVGDHR
jgi:histidine kinase